MKTKTDGIIVIICLCYHCWEEIIVYPYFIWLNILFGLMKQKHLLMSLRLDIWLTQVWILIKHSNNKCKILCILDLVKSHNLLLNPHYQNINITVLASIIFFETRGDNPKKAFRVLSCVIYRIIKHYDCIDYLACQSKQKVK